MSVASSMHAKGTLRTTLNRIGIVLCACCLSWLLLNTICFNDYFRYDMRWLLPMVAAVWSLAGIGIACILRRGEPSRRASVWVVSVYLTLLFVLQVTFGILLEYGPICDVDAVYGGAIEWLGSGSFTNNPEYEQYFYYFPNNLGLLTVFYLWFRLCTALGIGYFFGMAVVLNALLATAAIGVSLSIVQKLLGRRAMLCGVMLFAAVLPFYFTGAVFYTDSMSLLFPVLTYRLHLWAKDQTRIGRKIAVYALAAGIAFIGMKIKFTVAVMLIAIVLEILTTHKLKTALCCMLTLGAVIAALMSLFDAYMYNVHLDRARAQQENTPILHWIMMGLPLEEGWGTCSMYDYDFTRSFDTTQERDAAIFEKFKFRLYRHRYPNRFINLISRKNTMTFGDGMFGLWDILDDHPVRHTPLHDIVFYNKEKTANIIYRYFCAAVYTLLLAVGAAGCWKAAVRKNGVYLNATGIPLALLGIWMFLSMWETSPRYFFNYLPVLVIAAVMGCCCLAGKRVQANE